MCQYIVFGDYSLQCSDVEVSHSEHLPDPDQSWLGPTLSHPPGPPGPDLSSLLGAVVVQKCLFQGHRAFGVSPPDLQLVCK